jgi:HPt (histidine-containing phosphotransfer) domain-containing protein
MGRLMIDWGRVAELRDEVGIENFSEVVSLFLEEADEATQRPLAPGDARSLESLLHFLKGSALSLGFSDLALLCQTGERLAAQGDASTDLNQIRAVYSASKAAFSAGLDGLGISAA